jgi:mannitol 2-dehydrogenase
MIDFIHAPSNPREAMDILCDQRVRIVSMTITEGGYNIDQATGQFLTSNSTIQQEAQSASPRSVFGYVVGALSERRQRGIAPFAVLSCDNLVHNGRVAARSFCTFAEMRDPELAEWMRSSVAFPNTMVDRITPVTTPRTKALTMEMLGVEDHWPVACESFTQWVIEDTFRNGRPAFEKVGAQMTSDVTPYEVMKIRLLNAGHLAIGYLGYLCGFEHVCEIMNDSDFQSFIKKFWDDEVSSHVREVPGVDLGEYKRSLFERFSNPNIKDQSLRICNDGSNKLPKFLLPTIREALREGAPIKLMSLVVASWMRFVNGTDEKGQVIPLNDPRAGSIQPIAKRGGASPTELLTVEEVFGDLGANERFVAEVGAALRDLYQLGARQTVRKYSV